MTVALIYVRQSRHKPDERTTSPETQESACRGLPAVRRCDGVEVFMDLDKSGKSVAGRKEFQAFLSRIEAGHPAVVAAFDQSRTFRNTTEALAFYALMERTPDVEVAFYIGSFDRSPVGEFSYTALAAAHTMERKMTGRKISEAKRYAISRGEMVGPVPLGYRRLEDAAGALHVQVDEDWAPIVRRAFEIYAAGMTSTRRLAMQLNAAGDVPPGFAAGWRADTLSQILAHPAYIGMMPKGGRTGSGELVRGNWPSLVDQEVWDAAQRVRRRNRGNPRGGGASFRAYAFQGLLRCARCGGRMHAQTQTRGRVYYWCRLGVNRSDQCRNGLREDRILPWAASLLEALDRYRPEDFQRRVAERQQRDRPRTSPSAIAQLESTMARVAKRFEWGHITEDEYLAERGRLVALRTELTRAIEEPAPARLPLGGLAEAWQSGDPGLRRRLLAVFFDEIDVLDGRVVSVVPAGINRGEIVALLELVEADSIGGPYGISGNSCYVPHEVAPAIRFA